MINHRFLSTPLPQTEKIRAKPNRRARVGAGVPLDNSVGCPRVGPRRGVVGRPGVGLESAHGRYVWVAGLGVAVAAPGGCGRRVGAHTRALWPCAWPRGWCAGRQPVRLSHGLWSRTLANMCAFDTLIARSSCLFHSLTPPIDDFSSIPLDLMIYHLLFFAYTFSPMINHPVDASGLISRFEGGAMKCSKVATATRGCGSRGVPTPAAPPRREVSMSREKREQGGLAIRHDAAVCTMTFGRPSRHQACPRCEELKAGAVPRSWAVRHRPAARRQDEIAQHFASAKHRTGGCGPVCTFGEY